MRFRACTYPPTAGFRTPPICTIDAACVCHWRIQETVVCPVIQSYVFLDSFSFVETARSEQPQIGPWIPTGVAERAGSALQPVKEAASPPPPPPLSLTTVQSIEISITFDTDSAKFLEWFMRLLSEHAPALRSSHSSRGWADPKFGTEIPKFYTGKWNNFEHIFFGDSWFLPPPKPPLEAATDGETFFVRKAGKEKETREASTQTQLNRQREISAAQLQSPENSAGTMS